MSLRAKKRTHPAGVDGGTGWLRLALVVLLAGLGGGCETAEKVSLTCKLWDTDAISFCQPAPNPELAVFLAPAQNDLLVEYNAISDQNVKVSRLAYFLADSQTRIAGGRAPHFVKPANYVGLQPLPHGVSTNEYVLAGAEGKSFTLFRPNQPPEHHDLPFYEDDHWSVTRVALTPVAVTGDAVMLGAFGGVLAVWVLCENGTTIH